MKLTKYILLGGLGLLSLASCNRDFLNVTPTANLSNKDAEATEPGIVGLVNGLHNMMYMYNFGQVFSYGFPSMNVQLDMLGDDVINTKPAVHMAVYRWQDHRDRTDTDKTLTYKAWDGYYTLILHANKAIAGYRTILPEEERKHVATRYAYGEALAIRAYAYHQLVQLFAKRYRAATAATDLGVILRTDKDQSKQFEPMERSTVAETYKQIEEDLKESLDVLKGLEQATDRNHLRYSTVCGIAARVALCKEDWAAAEDYATQAIQKSNSRLAKGEELIDGFNNYKAPEWMWGYHQSDTQDTGWGSFSIAYSYNVSGHNKYLRYAINRDIYDQLGSGDVRRKWWVCLDQGDQVPKDAYSVYFAMNGDVPQWEITGQCIKFRSKAQGSTFMDLVMMRVAEMYYIKAEAEARQGKEAAARQTLLDVVSTRDAAFTLPTESGDALIDKIFAHKRIDLYMEGVRFLDLKRLAKAFDRSKASNFTILLNYQGLGGGKNAYTVGLNRNTGNLAKEIPTTADDNRWQFVIPYQELKGNKLCQDNP